MALRSAMLAVAASVLLLAGCATAPPMPAPMTQAEAEELVDASNLMRWNQMFPGELMPQIEPVKTLEAGASWTEITDCLRATNIEGVTFNSDGSSNRTVASTPEREHAVNVAQFVCQLKYPVDLSDPAKLGFFTDDELKWIWNYNRTRLIPCLQQLGFSIPSSFLDEYVDGSSAYSVPYFDMTPVPASEEEWARIDLRCPPSPIAMPFPRPTAG